MKNHLLLPAILILSAPFAFSADQTSISKELLEEIRLKYDVPSLAAAIVLDGDVIVTNATGLRKMGSSENVTAEDKYHLGSLTKSMTATVAAKLVEQGKLSWRTTIEESFPEFQDHIHPDYLQVTLEQLLAHRGGAPANPPADFWAIAWAARGTPAEQRMSFAKELLQRKPETVPGTRTVYSNQGYAIAGVMLEKAAGQTWEELMQSLLFTPLNMESAGFGAPATPGKVDQPWGHAKTPKEGIQPVPPGPHADNPLAIAPAGAIHCSLDDLAKYAAFHLAGARGEGKWLSPKSFDKLHAPVADGDFALGWVVTERDWAGGRALTHTGSNTTFFAVIWIAPERNLALIAATNTGADAAFAACDETIAKLLIRFR